MSLNQVAKRIVNIRFATRLYTIPNNYSAVYQDELALLLIQTNLHLLSIAFRDLRRKFT